MDGPGCPPTLGRRDGSDELQRIDTEAGLGIDGGLHLVPAGRARIGRAADVRFTARLVEVDGLKLSCCGRVDGQETDLFDDPGDGWRRNGVGRRRITERAGGEALLIRGRMAFLGLGGRVGCRARRLLDPWLAAALGGGWREKWGRAGRARERGQ